MTLMSMGDERGLETGGMTKEATHPDLQNRPSTVNLHPIVVPPQDFALHPGTHHPIVHRPWVRLSVLEHQLAPSEASVQTPLSLW